MDLGTLRKYGLEMFPFLMGGGYLGSSNVASSPWEQAGLPDLEKLWKFAGHVIDDVELFPAGVDTRLVGSGKVPPRLRDDGRECVRQTVVAIVVEALARRSQLLDEEGPRAVNVHTVRTETDGYRFCVSWQDGADSRDLDRLGVSTSLFAPMSQDRGDVEAKRITCVRSFRLGRDDDGSPILVDRVVHAFPTHRMLEDFLSFHQVLVPPVVGSSLLEDEHQVLLGLVHSDPIRLLSDELCSSIEKGVDLVKGGWVLPCLDRCVDAMIHSALQASVVGSRGAGPDDAMEVPDGAWRLLASLTDACARRYNVTNLHAREAGQAVTGAVLRRMKAALSSSSASMEELKTPTVVQVLSAAMRSSYDLDGLAAEGFELPEQLPGIAARVGAGLGLAGDMAAMIEKLVAENKVRQGPRGKPGGPQTLVLSPEQSELFRKVTGSPEGDRAVIRAPSGEVTLGLSPKKG